MADRKFIAKSTAARSFRKCEKSNHKTYLWIRAFLYHLAFNGIIWNEKCLTDKKMKTNLWILLVDRLVIIPAKLLPTHSYQKTNSLIFLSFFCLLLYSAVCTMGWCYRLTSSKAKLGRNVPSSNKVYFWCL